MQQERFVYWGILQQTEDMPGVADVFAAQLVPGKGGKTEINRRVRSAIQPLPGRQRHVQPERVARQAHPAHAEFIRQLQHNPKNRRMQVEVQMAVHVVEREAGGAEFFKLRADFPA